MASDEGSRPTAAAELRVTVSREVRVPDPVRLARLRKVPELGPRLLFFSGGTALNPLSRQLTEFTHSSIHLVTPFDSGGSSAKLRDAFGMPSVGDLRSRLMALADQTVTGHPEIYRLFAYRFPKDGENRDLRGRLAAMVAGDEPLVAAIPDPMRKLIRNHLRFFEMAMPDAFDLRGASIGNLILVGGYLNNDRHIDPVVFMFSKLVEVLGTVRTVVNADLHLAATLEDGRVVLGQRNLTGKEVPPLETRIVGLSLVKDQTTGEPANTEIRQKTQDLIAAADLICYPLGSFYSSILANLLPEGVAEAIAANPCPKVYVPNMGADPEQESMPISECVKQLLSVLTKKSAAVSEVLNYVVADTVQGDYPEGVGDLVSLAPDVQLLDIDLVSATPPGLIDPGKLIAVLLSLA